MPPLPGHAAPHLVFADPHTLLRGHRAWVALIVAATMTAFATAADATQALGCNGHLVNKGESPVSVLQKCGEPVYRQPVCVSMLQLGWIAMPFHPGSPGAVLASQCVPMEEWTYDRGPGAYMGIVRIYNGSIESVRDGDRRP